MTTFFHDEDTPTVVDSNQVGNEIAGDYAQNRPILWAHDVNLVLGHKQGSTPKNRIQPTRLV